MGGLRKDLPHIPDSFDYYFLIRNIKIGNKSPMYKKGSLIKIELMDYGDGPMFYTYIFNRETNKMTLMMEPSTENPIYSLRGMLRKTDDMSVLESTLQVLYDQDPANRVRDMYEMQHPVRTWLLSRAWCYHDPDDNVPFYRTYGSAIATVLMILFTAVLVGMYFAGLLGEIYQIIVIIAICSVIIWTGDCLIPGRIKSWDNDYNRGLDRFLRDRANIEHDITSLEFTESETEKK